jgi:hypothetical protein
MSNISITVAVVLVVALVVVALLVVLARGGRLKTFRLKLLKGLFDLDGTIDTHAGAGGDAKQGANGMDADHVEDMAHKIIHWLREQKPQRVKGCYVLTDSTHDNAQTAAKLYTRVDGEIIATCFFESPHYGRGDFASNITQKASFVRLTSSDICADDVACLARKCLGDFYCKASLVVVPKGVEISRIGGIFCHLSDRSYLAFIAMNNAQDTSSNKGLVFSGTLAEELFTYFKGFVDAFRA